MSNVCANGTGSTCDRVITELKIDNPRFAFPSPQPVADGQDFWLRSGENVRAAWDSYIVFVGSTGATCNASTPVSSTCRRCDFVTPNNQDCPGALLFAPGLDLLTLSSFPGFDSQASPDVLAHIISGVRNLGFEFTPAGNATVQLSTSINDRGKLNEARLFLLADSMTQPVTYPLAPLSQNVPDVGFYSGSIPRNPVLADNFSTNLRVGRVRLWKGKPDADPVTGKFRIKDAAVVRPSRLVFIPDYLGDSVFSHDSARCYSDSSTDGDIDLTRCRSNPSGGGILQDLTPAYLKLAPQSTLTWVAEFRPSEGGVAPALEPGEVLAIEFTIQ